MQIGNFKQRASWFMVGFVFGCISIIILLLFVMVRAQEKADYLDSISVYGDGDVDMYSN